MKTYKPTVSQERGIKSYPSIRNHELVNAYVKEHQVSKSSVIDDALRLFFDSMPQEKRIQLLNNKADNKF
jgi:hypothetical protein